MFIKKVFLAYKVERTKSKHNEAPLNIWILNDIDKLLYHEQNHIQMWQERAITENPNITPVEHTIYHGNII
jgi:hypothetical protein